MSSDESARCIHPDAWNDGRELRDLDQRDQDAEHHDLGHRPRLHEVRRPEHLADPARRGRAAHRKQDR